jgi:GNAT superfamily N-acetyltransferase
MRSTRLRDKHEIEQFLRQDVYLHIYSLGDLDDFFWPYTTFFGLRTNGSLDAVALLYTGQDVPALLALSNDRDAMAELLCSIKSELPPQFYAHLSPGLEAVLDNTHHLTAHGTHHKMALQDEASIDKFDTSDVVPLRTAQLEEIQTFYETSYPGNWFDPRMLETKQYFGIRARGTLACVGGIHVYSPEYRVAALGNIATHPDHRGRGYGKAVTARICQSLSQTVEHIGLNVKADNHAAITCYGQLGFRKVAEYGEFPVRRR